MTALPPSDPYRPPESEHGQLDFFLSILLHAIVLSVAYYTISLRPTSEEAQRRVNVTSEAAFKKAASQRLNDLSHIGQALAQSTNQPKPPPLTATNSPQQALQQAREVYEAIRQNQHRARANDLATLLHIPLDEAMRRTDTDMPPPPPAAHTDAEAIAQMAQLQAQATIALKRYRDYLQRRDAQRAGLAGADGGGRGGITGMSQAPELDTALEKFNVLSDSNQPVARPAPGRPSPIPPIDGPVRAAGGRSIGAGGIYANRIYVDTWYVVGPFDAEGTRPLDHPYPPEFAVDLDGTYAGKFGKTLAWRYVQAGEYPTYLPDPAESAIYYGYTELMLDHDTDVWAWIGADDDCKLWVDDQLVWNGGAPLKPWFLVDARSMKREIADYNLSEGKVRLRLHAGRHRILFKLYNGVEVMFFSLVLSDAHANDAASGSQQTMSASAPLTH